MKWKNLIKASLLLTLFVNKIGAQDFHHSKRVTALDWSENPMLLKDLPRHFHFKKIEGTSTSNPEGFHHRKFRINNGYHTAALLQNDHRKVVIKGTFQPTFAHVLQNVTVPRGRDARFKCVVDHLGGYKVGWVKVDTKAIQAIHDHVITHNPRVSVSHSDHSTWYLLIKKVEEGDRGLYMCQVNTDPMIYQMAFLEVLHPPDFNMDETSDSVEVGEGSPLRLQCKAYGRPRPRIIWRRENGTELSIRDAEGYRVKVDNYSGEILELPKVMRSDMGDYVCIASNGVTPSISKTIRVTVRFHPMIQVPNQLVGAPLGTDVTLVCYAEAYPKSINYWLKDGKGEIIVDDDKYDVELKSMSEFEQNMTLKIKNLTNKDMGSYNCVCKNPVGEVSSQIRVYEIAHERSNFVQNKGSKILSSDLATKRPGKHLAKNLQHPALPSNLENSLIEDILKSYLPEESISRNNNHIYGLSFRCLLPCFLISTIFI